MERALNLGLTKQVLIHGLQMNQNYIKDLKGGYKYITFLLLFFFFHFFYSIKMQENPFHFPMDEVNYMFWFQIIMCLIPFVSVIHPSEVLDPLLPKRKITILGDTSSAKNIAPLAFKSDLLVHEVCQIILIVLNLFQKRKFF